MAGKKPAKKVKKGVGQGKGGGRPSKLTPKTVKTICDNIELGVPYEYACIAAGIHYTTMRDWINKGEDELARVASNPAFSIRKEYQKYIDFSNAIKEAEAAGIAYNLKCIKKAASGDEDNRPQWQAGAWLLERRHPEQFAKHEKIDQKTEHSGGVSIKLEMKDFSKKEE